MTPKHDRLLFPILALTGALLLAGCNAIESDMEGSDDLDWLESELRTCGAAIELASATASSNDGNVPANAIDGDRATRWSALGKGSTLTLDLGSAKPLCNVALAWHRGDVRRASFTLSISEDGAAFQQVVSATTSGTTLGFETFDLPAGSSGRYIRVTVNGTTESDWASITEVVVRTTGVTAPPSTGGTAAPVFNGTSGYVEIPDMDAYSQPTAAGLTVEAWIRPDSLSMSRRESSGYVHWMGKGGSNQHEWVARMYQAGNQEGRANRISFYAFNLAGGLGTGSYFQDTVRVGEWIHVVGRIDRSSTFISKNGTQRDSDPLSSYDITPRNGSAPVRIGTRDFQSFFQGSVARVAIYAGALPSARVQAHYQARLSGTYDQVVLAEPSLRGYWRLDETSGTTAVDATGRRNGTYKGGVSLGAARWTP